MNASVNTERILLTISGLFEGVNTRSMKVIVKFPLPNQNQYPCAIESIHNDRFIYEKDN